MNYIFQIKGKLDFDLLDRFTECVNQEHEKITIYLNCTGGSANVYEIMNDIINKNPDRFELIAMNGILSAAFMLFFKATCSKRIMMNTIGMIHQGNQEFTLNDNLKPTYTIDVAWKKRMKKEHLQGIEFVKSIGLNKKELKKYKRGDDVYFQYERLVELFNNYKP